MWHRQAMDATMVEPPSSGRLAYAAARSTNLATWIAEPELLLTRLHPARDLFAELLLTGAYSDGLAARPDPPGVPAVIAIADVVLAGACAGDPAALGIVRRMLPPSLPGEKTLAMSKSVKENQHYVGL